MEHGAIYYSEDLNRLVIIKPTEGEKLKVEAIKKNTDNYGEGTLDLNDIIVQLVKKKYELIGYL